MASMDWKKGMTGKVHLFLSVLKKFDNDHGFLLSAGITFNLLICLVPLILSAYAEDHGLWPWMNA